MSNIVKQDYTCYYNDMSLYSEAAQIQSLCQEITFYNKGTSIMVINEVPFSPGTGPAFDGKEGELDCTQYRLKFINTGTQTNSAFVIRKCYTNT